MPWRLIVEPLALRARRARHPPAGRRLLPRRRLRPRARRRRHVEGPRGQRAHAVGDLLRAGEPRRDDAPRARSSSTATACARSTTTRSCCSPALRAVAPVDRGRGDGRRLDARVRTTPPTSSTRSSRARWASSWSRPRDLVVRDDVLYMRTTAGLRARPRRLPAPGRRLRRSARVPPRLAARRARAGARLPRGHGRDRQRVRHRRRRRQGDLPLRPGDDPLLPRRGADPRQRPDLPAGRRRRCARTCSSRLHELVVKPTGERGGKGVFIGPPRRRTSSRGSPT